MHSFLILTLHNIILFLTGLIFPLNIRELAIEMSLDTSYASFLESNIFVVKLVPFYILDIPISSSSFIALTRTKSEMFPVCLFCCDESSITEWISTIFTVICFLTRIETLPYRGMSHLISHLGRDSSIEGIEITEPIPIIELIDIFDHSSLDREELRSSSLIREDGCLLTTNTTRTIPYYFFSFCLFSIFFEEFWYFTEIDRSCWDRIFEVTESVFIVISHINYEIIIGCISI